VEPHDLVSALSDPAAFPRPGPDVRVVHTHVSTVFLTGDRAYKVKKPVRFWGFLDYGTPERRRALCEEEVRIGRRWAPEVYLGVVPVVRRAGRLAVGGDGEVVDHAVEMARWPEGSTLSDRARDGRATLDDARAAAALLRAAHASAPRGAEVAREGRPVVFARVLRRNVASTRDLVPDPLPARLHDAVVARLAALLAASKDRLARRARERRLVEGHGDLRAEHLVLLGERPPRWRAVDAIEFSPALRCVDPLSDGAFLSMDLRAHARPDLAAAFEEAWLGDPPDLDAPALLPLFLAYRAHVRANVDALRSRRPEVATGERVAASASARRHLALSWLLSRRGGPPPLVVMVGLSGTGKSVVADAVAPLLDADVLRSDVVRKRLAGLAPTDRVEGDSRRRLYAKASSIRAYAAMLEEAERRLRAGRAVVLDATYLAREARARPLARAAALGVPFAFLEVVADEDEVRRRLERRAALGTDPSDADFAVHLAQRAEAEPLDRAERRRAVRWDGAAAPADAFPPLVEALARSAPA
jgi:aminoglycoside phosphotransferase family enzyme/predicted kinase